MIYALPATAAISIDGNPAEWSTLGSVTIQGATNWNAVGSPAPPPPAASDLSVRLTARWDTGALYLLAEATDDQHVNTLSGTPELIWQGDCLQIGFDTANNKGTPYDDTDDYEYGFALSNGSQVTYTWKLPTSAPAFAGAYKVVRAANKTTYEIKLVPADVKKTSFSAGMTLGFAFIMNEDDGSGREGFLQWMSGIGYTKDPSLFGVLKLQP
jgi:hypothetical protein